eukprot:124859-Chlamydomonas_euryale.AAC.1
MLQLLSAFQRVDAAGSGVLSVEEVTAVLDQMVRLNSAEKRIRGQNACMPRSAAAIMGYHTLPPNWPVMCLPPNPDGSCPGPLPSQTLQPKPPTR